MQMATKFGTKDLEEVVGTLKRISQTFDGGYLLAGDSTSNNASGDKSDNGKGGLIIGWCESMPMEINCGTKPMVAAVMIGFMVLHKQMKMAF